MEQNEVITFKLLNLIKKDYLEARTGKVWEKIFDECEKELENESEESESPSTVRGFGALSKEMAVKQFQIENLKAMALVTEAYNRQICIINKAIDNEIASMRQLYGKTNPGLNISHRSQLTKSYIQSITKKQNFLEQLSRELRLMLITIQSYNYILT